MTGSLNETGPFGPVVEPDTDKVVKKPEINGQTTASEGLKNAPSPVDPIQLPASFNKDPFKFKVNVIDATYW